ncbi:MAG: glycerophosphoryl diester phosphodiesterase [Rhodobacteraceae bacterium]|uniref:glycerophosphodiester phosphodiesterase family protein n=1 Tax=Cypionkella sp. TaxID=2811411 RepID=UPI00132C90A5|nr:glycerophosphodiester phosphodiesterase family protein [Cypionkella sp.]KAF0176236.1 MAG: glycerophosphoryl diester phosphodiesterase [Paracoccaceae bacterium]MDO8328595.1 glycerophosphodiester phosphodiesterase family protein [Cypionkella sp.]
MRAPLPAAFLRVPLAHRAYHDRSQHRPENSPGAVKAAIAAGYGIEIDLQLSSDGVAMVFHDEALDRLTNATGLLCDHTAATLSQIPLRDSDDSIPTLTEILALIAGQVPLLIELKDQTDSMSETDGRLEAATAAALTTYPGPVAVMSFNPHAIARMARLAPQTPRGLTTSAYDPTDWAPLSPQTCDRLRLIPDYDRTQSSFISHEAADLTRPRVAELKSQGAAILCWTIRNREAEAKAREVAQNITFEAYPAAFSA